MTGAGPVGGAAGVLGEAERRAPLGRDVAVVDVGSNSVRIVVYRVEGRAVWTVFNEKVLAGLGRGVSSSGRLSKDGVELALTALRRFKFMVDARPMTVFTAATAAVREAEDGPDFVEQVRSQTGLEIRVLSGAEEARYAALGVLAGDPAAEGVVGDLGGSSLELTRVHNGADPDEALGGGVTLPLGPFALAGADGFDLDKVRSRVAKRLAPAERGFRTKRFHAVGGAWRNLALLHMRLGAYPLEIIQQYALSAREALDLARFIARQSRGSLERIEGVSKKRVETLPYAALVLEGVVERLGVERVELSAYGVREGLIYEAMAPEVRALDPFLEGMRVLGARMGVAVFAEPLHAWLGPALESLEPVFPDDREAVLTEGVACLADAGAQFHPDHRADLVFSQVLRAPVAAWTHPERAFVALAAFSRYSSREQLPGKTILGRLLTPEQVERARALGAAMRLGADLSGRSPSLLTRTRLRLEPKEVVLSAKAEDADVLLGEPTRKRLQLLAALLDREPRTEIG